MIKVSVIVTCYNLEKYIVRAINSCINQSYNYENYEVIVIDDASTDNSREAISLYKGFGDYSFIKFKFLEKNKGIAHASNTGIKMARGKYIVRLDGDDYLHKDFLKVMSEILDWNSSIGFVHCDLFKVTGAGDKKHRKFALNSFERLLEHGAGVMFRRKYLEKIGCYNEKLRNCEDFDLILRYSKKYKGYHLRLPYYRYFKRKDGLSSLKTEREECKKRILDELS